MQRHQKLASCSNKYNSSTEHNLAGDAADDYESDETITDILQTASDQAEGESCLLATDDHNGNDLNCNSESAKFEDPECECSLQFSEAQELQITEERFDDIDVGANENYCKSYEDCLYDSETAKLSLYEGSGFTVLETIAAMFDWFSSHPNLSKSALSKMLTLQHSILPMQAITSCQAHTQLPKNFLSHFFYLLLHIMLVSMNAFCFAKHQGMTTLTLLNVPSVVHPDMLETTSRQPEGIITIPWGHDGEECMVIQLYLNCCRAMALHKMILKSYWS